MAEVLEQLNARQKAFADEYLIDFNGARAAVAAGYSAKTAKEMAYENLTKPHIAAYLQKRQMDRMKRTEFTQDKVLSDIDLIKADAMKSKTDRDGNNEMANHAAALKACELLGKHLKMFTDKTEITGADGQPLLQNLTVNFVKKK